MNRTWRQISFGSTYLLIFLLVAVGIYFLFLKPAPTCSDNKQNQKETGIDCGGPCIPCEVKGLNVITEETKILPAGENKITILAKFKNPSQNFSINFSYKFNSIRGNVAIAPAASKYIVIPGVAASAKNVSFEISEPSWQSETKTEPTDVNITVKTNIEEARVTVTGTFINSSATSFPRIDLIAILFTKEGEILNASVTQLEKVEAFSQKEFTVFFPEISGLIENLDPARTEVYWEVNE